MTAMTTNQTIDGVPRELLERIREKLSQTDYTWSTGDPEDELRALLDAPEPAWNPHPDVANLVALLIALAQHGIKVTGGNGSEPWCVDPAAQPQGEPVAWIAQAIGNGGEVYRNRASTVEPTMRDVEIAWGPGVIDRFTIVIKPLYAEQPAPAAVAMPERLQQVLKFLEGAENLDGHWFGEPGPTGQIYWWRNELRKALAETNLFANQQ